MRWNEDQQDRITEAAIAACPALDAIPDDALVAWVDRAEASGVSFEQAVTCLTELALSHRKGQPRPQPGDVLQSLRAIAVQARSIQHGGPKSARLSDEAASELPRLSELFARSLNGAYVAFYGRPVVYAGDSPWPPANVVDAAYADAKRVASETREPSPDNPYAKHGGTYRAWNRPRAAAIIRRRVFDWYASQT